MTTLTTKQLYALDDAQEAIAKLHLEKNAQGKSVFGVINDYTNGCLDTIVTALDELGEQ